MSADLALSTTARRGCVIVSVAGEVDLGTATQLSEHTVAAMQERGPNMVLDLSAVTFMDSTGLKVLLACQRRTRLAGGELGLSGPAHSVGRVLSVTGLDQVFVIRDTVDETVDALAGTIAGDAHAVAD